MAFKRVFDPTLVYCLIPISFSEIKRGFDNCLCDFVLRKRSIERCYDKFLARHVERREISNSILSSFVPSELIQIVNEYLPLPETDLFDISTIVYLGNNIKSSWCSNYKHYHNYKVLKCPQFVFEQKGKVYLDDLGEHSFFTVGFSSPRPSKVCIQITPVDAKE